MSELDNMDKHRELVNISERSELAVFRKGGNCERFSGPFKEAIKTASLKPDTESYIIAHGVTLAETLGTYDVRKDASLELMELASVINTVVVEAKKKFFA
jgi:hypothetical protein